MASIDYSMLKRLRSQPRDPSSIKKRFFKQSDGTYLDISSLHNAARLGLASRVKKILKHGVDIDARDQDGKTALALAVECFSERTTILLLKYGADPAAGIDSMNNTVLHYAITHGHDENFLKILLTTKPNFKITSSEMSDRVLHYALSRKNARLIKYLFRNVDINSITDSKIKELILFEEEPIIDLRNIEGFTALMLSMFHEIGLNIVKFLLKNSARVDLLALPVNYEDVIYTSASVFHLAIIRNCIYWDVPGEDILINLFINDYCKNVNLATEEGITALHIAARFGNLHLAKVLLGLGADVNLLADFPESKNLSPLHLAVITHNFDMFKLLLDTKKVNQSTLEYAAWLAVSNYYSKDIGNLIVHVCMSGDYKDQKYQNMVFHLAIALHDQETIDFFFNNHNNVNAIEWGKSYPIHQAVMSNNLDCLTSLIDLGADVDTQSQSAGTTALHLAVRKSSKSTIIFLLSKSANVNVLTTKGITVLEIAFAKKNNSEVVELLLDAGADISLMKKFPDNIKEYSTTLLRHFMKLKAANMYIDPASIFYSYCNSKIYDEKFLNDCNEEIDQIKKRMICTTSFVSYYNFLTNNVGQLANYTRNVDINSGFQVDKIKIEFPIYSQMIIVSYNYALNRFKLIQNIENFFFEVFNNLPLTFVRKIPSYLSVDDLKFYYFVINKKKTKT